MDDWVTILCGQCDERFQVQRATYNVWRRSSQNWYCPHGHKRHYPQGQSEADKLRDQLAEERRQRQRAEQNVAMWRDDAAAAREEAQHERRRANGYKGHATRITKRAKAGVCPCCNRSFENLRRHMASQHPTFTPMPLEADTQVAGNA